MYSSRDVHPHWNVCHRSNLPVPPANHNDNGEKRRKMRWTKNSIINDIIIIIRRNFAQKVKSENHKRISSLWKEDFHFQKSKIMNELKLLASLAKQCIEEEKKMKLLPFFFYFGSFLFTSFHFLCCHCRVILCTDIYSNVCYIYFL